MTHGNYYRPEEVEKLAPEIMDEWNLWLKVNFDPGNYDAYKDRSNGSVWVCDSFMPKEIELKLPESVRKK